MKDSEIEWTDHTYNPWHGCTKVSDGCKYCYMYREKERFKNDPTIVNKSKTAFKFPLSKAMNQDNIKDNNLVFTCSLSDFFIESADEWRDEVWKMIKETPWLTYQILTKRPERIQHCLPSDWGYSGYENVWLGVSIESYKYLDRLPELMRYVSLSSKFKTFVSYEPALSPVNFAEAKYLPFLADLDWMVIGGESGNEIGKYKYREAQLWWFEDVIMQCDQFHVKVFMKQMGTYLSKQMMLESRHGRIMDEWPKRS